MPGERLGLQSLAGRLRRPCGMLRRRPLLREAVGLRLPQALQLRQPLPLPGRQPVQQRAGLGELPLHGPLCRAQLGLRDRGRLPRARRVRPLCAPGRRLVRGGRLLPLRGQVHERGPVGVRLHVRRGQQRRGTAERRRPVRRRRAGTALLPRRAEDLGAVGLRAAQAAGAAPLPVGGFLGPARALGRGAGLPVQVVDLALDLLHRRLVVAGGGHRVLGGQQRHGGEGGRGEADGGGVRADRTGGAEAARLAMRRQGSASPSVGRRAGQWKGRQDRPESAERRGRRGSPKGGRAAWASTLANLWWCCEG